MHLRPGTMVTIDPRGQTGADSVPAYVRISDRTGPLTFEGYTSAAAFGALLQADRPYDVLIVPSAPDRTGVGALYAPLLIGNQTPDQIRILPLRLSPGIGEETLDLRLHALPLGFRRLGHREAFADLLRPVGEHREDRPPQVPAQQIKDDEEVDDRNEHPERVNDESRRTLLGE
jgi:hypothetical protein